MGFFYINFDNCEGEKYKQFLSHSHIGKGSELSLELPLNLCSGVAHEPRRHLLIGFCFSWILATERLIQVLKIFTLVLHGKRISNIRVRNENI